MIRNDTRPSRRRRPLLGSGDYAGDPSGTPYVTASIVSQTAEDGSALDNPLSLVYCGTGDTCQSIPADGSGPEGKTNQPGQPGSSTGAKTGGSGSGGLWPFGGGLPLNLPELPSAAKYLVYAALIAGGVWVIGEARR